MKKNMKLVSAAAVLVATTLSTSFAAADSYQMASTYPSRLIQLGPLGQRLADNARTVSGGEIDITFYEPKALVPSFEVFDAVSTGAIDMGWSAGSYSISLDPAFSLFTSVPFGPDAAEFVAWQKFGGGRELMEKLYHSYNIHPIACGIIAPEASGWFREEIKTVEDLDGLVMRFSGLGGRAMEKLGVSVQLLPGGEIYGALELGTIDATEFSMPAIDLALGFHQVASHYYFPGWHQPATQLTFMVNLDLWNGLGEAKQAQLNAVCGDNVLYGLAEGEAIQGAAIAEMESKGVQIHRWSPEQIAAFQTAWSEVKDELVDSSPNFAEGWESLSNFREEYKLWRARGYLQPGDFQ